MYKKFHFSIVMTMLAFVATAQTKQVTTSANKELLLSTKSLVTNEKESAVVSIMPNTTYQSIKGWGYALTGGSAKLLSQLPKAQRTAVLKDLFTKEGIGVNYLRISIGASDLDEKVFSYDDLAVGQTDPTLAHFNLGYDSLYLIPILKEIIALQPSIQIMASPWSPPVWMKDNKNSMGGHLLPEYYKVYANYFVKYLRAMKKHGIAVQAITIQNEPEHGGNNPSLLMTAEEQNEFIKTSLGTLFKKEGIKTEIVIYDHNADHPNYPISILNDAATKPFVSASAFHLYLGEEKALSTLHEKHPDKPIYFTEQWTGAKGDFDGDLLWHWEHIVMGTIKNWSSVVLEWNLAADALYLPHTPGGCTECKGALTIENGEVMKNVSYYIIGQFSSLMQKGATRVASTETDSNVTSLACRLSDGSYFVMLLNKSEEKVIRVQIANQSINMKVPAKAATSFIWKTK
jgi:glucosylceramidase